MNLSPGLKKKYTKDLLSARKSQRLAEFIAWSPFVFHASRLMVKFGILDIIKNSKNGLIVENIHDNLGLGHSILVCKIYN